MNRHISVNDAGRSDSLQAVQEALAQEEEMEEEEDEPLIPRRVLKKESGRHIEETSVTRMEKENAEEEVTKRRRENVHLQSISRSLLKRPPKDLLQRVTGATGGKVRQDSESEFEDDGTYVPPPKRRSVGPQQKSVFCEKPTTRATTTTTLKANTCSESTRLSTIGPVKQRNRSLAWTPEEEVRLMELVPRFRYSDAEQPCKGTRKRTVKWAELKRHDEKLGNILKHRDQTMLKDKFRRMLFRRQ